MNKQKFFIAALLQTFLIGFSFLFAKSALASDSALWVLSKRFTVSLVVYSLYLLITHHKVKLKSLDYVRLLPLGILYPIVFFLFQSLGLLYITSSESGIFFATVPIFTFLFAPIILKEIITKRNILGMISSILGITIIIYFSGPRLSGNYIGYFYTLISVISSSLFITLQKKYIATYAAKDLTFYLLLSGFIGFHLSNLIYQSQLGTLTGYFITLFSAFWDINILYLGVFASVLSVFLSAYAAKGLRASTLSLFPNLATLISMIAGSFILHDPLYLYHFLGALFILSGVFLAVKGKKSIS